MEPTGILLPSGGQWGDKAVMSFFYFFDSAGVGGLDWHQTLEYVMVCGFEAQTRHHAESRRQPGHEESILKYKQDWGSLRSLHSRVLLSTCT